MATAAQIVRQALSKLGVLPSGQAVSGDDMAACFRALNTMLDGWRVQELLAWQDTETVFTLGPEQASATIGPGMQFDTPMPARLEEGSYTRIGGIDRPLRVIDGVQFNALPIKAQGGSWPGWVSLERGASTGLLRFFPQGQAEVHLVTRVPFNRFENLTTDYPLAAGYERALVYNLAIEVSDDFGVEPPMRVQRSALQAIRAVKGKSVTVPQLDVGGPSASALRGAMFGAGM